MRTIIIVSAILAVLGTFMAQLADRMTQSRTQTASADRARVMNAYASMDMPQTGGRRVMLAADGRGHFQTEARVDGRDIGFLVDTGATVIALTETDAARIGIRPYASDYTTTVTTANGSAKAASARINSIDVGGVVVHDVDALVMPDHALSQNLLGMAFLSRLKRFEYSGGRLLLEQ
ncbi:MAG: TIGR02281 family clan AA aspartic protease [Bradyrhizobiaceae bacterium]|nr:MAG: TIGR02281 family clan AA aspartic protease [Bradyrhizobiaceae bacterium]